MSLWGKVADYLKAREERKAAENGWITWESRQAATKEAEPEPVTDVALAEKSNGKEGIRIGLVLDDKEPGR